MNALKDPVTVGQERQQRAKMQQQMQQAQMAEQAASTVQKLGSVSSDSELAKGLDSE